MVAQDDMETSHILILVVVAVCATAGQEISPPSLCQRVNGSSVRQIGCISEALVPKDGTFQIALQVQTTKRAGDRVPLVQLKEVMVRIMVLGRLKGVTRVATMTASTLTTARTIVNGTTTTVNGAARTRVVGAETVGITAFRRPGPRLRGTRIP